jgi:hypothetical protein
MMIILINVLHVPKYYAHSAQKNILRNVNVEKYYVYQIASHLLPFLQPRLMGIIMTVTYVAKIKNIH